MMRRPPEEMTRGVIIVKNVANPNGEVPEGQPMTTCPWPNASLSRVVCVDCGTRTGWAVGLPDGSVESGFQEFDVRRGESPGMRFLRFRIWLTQVCEDIAPEVLVFEQAHHRGGSATEVGVGLATRVVEVAASLGIEHKAVQASALKQFATGDGGAGKPQMVAAAVALYPHFAERAVVAQDDNEADALLMLQWARAGFPEGLPKVRRRKPKVPKPDD